MDIKINSVNITEFGALENFQLEFSGGLNIIKGKNESGKSTVLLFVMYMLYGLPTSTRRGTPGAYDKDRSLSRRSLRAQGSMEIERNGVRYRIERANIRRGKKSEVVVTDLATGERMFVGEEPGVALLGVSRETFESCLWSAQSRASVINSEGVRETLSNLSLTADESVNGDKVLKALREEKKRYKYEKGSGGLIHEASQKVETARERINQIDIAMKNTSEWRAELEIAEAKKGFAEERMDLLDKARRAAQAFGIVERFDKLSALKRELGELQNAKETLSSRYSVAQCSPDRETLYSIKNLRENLSRYRAELEVAKQAVPQSERVDSKRIEVAERISELDGEDGFINRIKVALSRARKMRGGAVTAIAFGAILTVLGALSPSVLGVAILAFCLAAVSVCSGILLFSKAKKLEDGIQAELIDLGTDRLSYEGFIRGCFAQQRIYFSHEQLYRRAQERVEDAERRLASAEVDCDALFSNFGIKYSDEAAGELMSQIAAYLKEKESVEREISLRTELIRREAESLEKYDEAALRAELEACEIPLMDSGRAEAEYVLASEEYRLAESRISDLRVRIAASGFDADARADAVAELERAKEERAEYADKFAILDRAYSAVEEAYGNMRRNFAPKIRERAGEFLSDMSEGRYSKVMLSEDMEISVEDVGEEVAVGTLSSGTADAVYMSLRMALVKNIFEGSVPLFMDETLTQLDDGRAQNALRMIDRFASDGSQCLLFTCHSREATLCEALGVDFNLIEL